MARIGADGRLRSYEQVLTGEKFATIKVDQRNQGGRVARHRPAGRDLHLALHELEVWSYRYKESRRVELDDARAFRPAPVWCARC